MTVPEDRRFDPATDNDLIPDTKNTAAEESTDRGTTEAVPGERFEESKPETVPGDRIEESGPPVAPENMPVSKPETVPPESEPLVAADAVVDFRARWDVIQQGFVDDPRDAVSEADRLVGDLLTQLAETFDRQHRELEKEWSNGEPSTEDLRTALQRYRSFFRRLLTL